MRASTKTANHTLLDIIDDCRRKGLSIGDTVEKCNEWQKKRMEAEELVFGSAITRELTKKDVREAIYFLGGGRLR